MEMLETGRHVFCIPAWAASQKDIAPESDSTGHEKLSGQGDISVSDLKSP